MSTLGGNVAENAGGLRGLKYGVTRDYVMGLQFFDVNGEPIKTGARTVKCATGYNLAGLLVGSEGTLGVFSQITLKLIPLPAAQRAMMAVFDHADRASDRLGYCQSGMEFSVGSICAHRGEEPVISGPHGICNIFFTHCNMQCVYCQNWQISRRHTPVADSRVEGVRGALATAVRGVSCFEMLLRGLSGWPRGNRARVLAVGAVAEIALHERGHEFRSHQHRQTQAQHDGSRHTPSHVENKNRCFHSYLHHSRL